MNIRSCFFTESDVSFSERTPTYSIIDHETLKLQVELVSTQTAGKASDQREKDDID